MRFVHASGVAGARGAEGLVVVIDVIRAFTVSAYALAGGAPEAVLTGTVEEAQAVAAELPGSVISAEVGGLPVPGIRISNSPTMVCQTALQGRTLVQRTSAGTQTAIAARGAELLLAGSLVTARATAEAIRRRNPAVVTLVAAGGDAGDVEDVACARYLEGLIRGRCPDLGALLGPLYGSARYRAFREGSVAGFPPTDLDLALAADRFGFAMPIRERAGRLRLRAASPVELGAAEPAEAASTG